MKQEMKNLHCTKLLIFILLKTLTCHGQQSGEAQCPSSRFADSVSNFGASVSRFLGKEQNAVFSALSLHNALAMLYNGAEGTTAKQMEDALQFVQSGLDKRLLNEGVQTYLNDLKSSNEKKGLQVYSHMLISKDCSLKEQYTNDLQTYYHTVLQEDDFELDAEGAKNRINNLMANETQQIIDDFFRRSFRPNTLLILANAIYFQGIWDFNFSDVTVGAFYKLDGTTQLVPFLIFNFGTFAYYEDEVYKFLELPYKGQEFSLLLALPKTRGTEPHLRMTSDRFCKVKAGLTASGKSFVLIPEFEIRFRMGLIDTFANMGVESLLGYSINLTRISDEFNYLKVADMVHQAEFGIKQNASIAAAANRAHARSSNQEAYAYTFYANQPFAFYIIDNKDGIVLYSGRVYRISR